MSKGSGRRPQQITDEEAKLRWELWQKGTTAERKREIKAALEKSEWRRLIQNQ